MSWDTYSHAYSPLQPPRQPSQTTLLFSKTLAETSSKWRVFLQARDGDFKIIKVRLETSERLGEAARAELRTVQIESASEIGALQGQIDGLDAHVAALQANIDAKKAEEEEALKRGGTASQKAQMEIEALKVREDELHRLRIAAEKRANAAEAEGAEALETVGELSKKIGRVREDLKDMTRECTKASNRADSADRAKLKAAELDRERSKVLRLELDFGKDQVELLTDQQHLLLQLLGLLRRLYNRFKQQPLREELEDYAEYLGIDMAVDSNLLWIAEEAYFAPLPENFEEHTNERGDKYYYNPVSKDSAWAHPMDTYFRKMAMAFSIKNLMAEPKVVEEVEEEGPKGLDKATSQAMGRMLAASFPEGVTRENLQKMQMGKPGGKAAEALRVDSELINATVSHAFDIRMDPVMKSAMEDANYERTHGRRPIGTPGSTMGPEHFTLGEQPARSSGAPPPPPGRPPKSLADRDPAGATGRPGAGSRSGSDASLRSGGEAAAAAAAAGSRPVNQSSLRPASVESASDQSRPKSGGSVLFDNTVVFSDGGKDPPPAALPVVEPPPSSTASPAKEASGPTIYGQPPYEVK